MIHDLAFIILCAFLSTVPVVVGRVFVYGRGFGRVRHG